MIVDECAIAKFVVCIHEIIHILAGDYVERMKQDDPEQFIAIGYLKNALLSVIYEVRYDDEETVRLV